MKQVNQKPQLVDWSGNSFTLSATMSMRRAFLKGLFLGKNFSRKHHTSLIEAEGGSTPVGLAGQVRPHRSVSDEEAHRPPHGKRASWSGNSPLLFYKLLLKANIIKSSPSN
ncbi:hypothetical protein AB986_13430 [Alkalihalobacillus macyae]|uniref:Uncharacterized protein n=1 Tax=Guptibacillus hwajinpoensis TaxID=208199 RepID=A0A0J6CUY6_9BACL|nr:hypothetical protein AB986_13430 [Alkalihalobacillus macyae]